jgi:hypothetical protein
LASATFQVDSYQFYDWSSRMTGKTNLILSPIFVFFNDDNGFANSRVST